MHRVVVTGMGCVTPLGIGVQPTWEALRRGQSGVGPITRFDTTDHAVRIAAEVKGFDPDDFIDRRASRRMDLYVQYALVASREALDDSGLVVDESNGPDVGVIMGSGIGGIQTWEREHQALMERGPSRVSAFFIPMLISNMAAGQIAMEVGAKGPNLAVVTACATASHAIGIGLRLVRSGEARAIIAGGSEASVSPLAVAGFANMKALSTRNEEPQRACRPFDRDRSGFVIAEGAGAVVLETLEDAQARGATIHAELLGFGMSADAFHMTQPDPTGDGPRRAILACLGDAGVRPQEVDYINAHAPGTPVGDEMEALVIRSVFGDRPSGLLVSSTKSMHGHLLGAGGAVELIATIKAMKHGVVPPTLNHEHPDPAVGELDVVPGVAREHAVTVAISNSFGFGGQNATLCVRRV